MKKLIAVSVALALAATGAFAQEVTIGGFTSFASDIVTGNNDKNPDGSDTEIMTLGTMNVLRLQGSGSVSTGVGEFGGWVRFQPTHMGFFDHLVNGHVWWAPNEMFRLTMGTHPDGWHSMDGRARWGFYRMVNDNIGMGFNLAGEWSYVNTNDPILSFNTSFYGGWSEGIMLEISPMEMLDININLPVSWLDGEKETGDMFAELNAQLGLNLDFGTIGLTYVGSSEEHNSGKIYAYLGLSAIENVGIDFGAGFHLVEDAAVIGIGAAVAVGISAEFDLAARVNATIETEEFGDTGLMFELLPSYALTPNVRGFLGVGLALVLPDEGDADMAFHVSPYLEVGSTWGPTFYAGFELRSVTPGGGDGVMTWRIPVGMYIAF